MGIARWTLWMMACAAPMDGQLPPPQALVMNAPAMYEGVPANVVIEGAAPGADVYLGASAARSGRQLCPPVFTDCLDLLQPTVLLGAARADGTGRASLVVTPPPNSTGLSVSLQGATIGTPAKTQLVQRVVGDGDFDGVIDSADPCPDDAPDDANGDGTCDSDPPAVVRFTPVRRNLADPVRRARAYDEALLLSHLQGLSNREGPQLWLDAEPNDAAWWSRLEDQGVFAGRAVVQSTSFEDTLAAFLPRGLVVWDPAVPATVNLATTASGVEDLLPVRHDPAAGSLYHWLVLDPAGPGYTVALDLRGLFTGSGVIPDIGRASTGSAKHDAYLWAIERYIRSGLVTHEHLGYTLDGYFLQDTPRELLHGSVWSRDEIVQLKAFAFDLGPWDDHAPAGAPGAPFGADLMVLKEMMAAVFDLHGGEGITTVHGFTPWFAKYTLEAGGSTSTHGAVETEWETARLLSQYNALFDADAFGYTSMPNASVHRHAEAPELMEQRPSPQAQDLRDRGMWDNRLTNASFEEGLQGWTTTLAAVPLGNPTVARFGYGSMELPTLGPSDSIYQDEVATLDEGEVVRGSLWARNPSTTQTARATFALWSRAAAADLNETLELTLAPGQDWTRFELEMVLPQDTTSVRVQVYPRAGSIQLDGTALSFDEAPVGVTDAHYAAMYAGDYDSAAWIYHHYDRVWNDPNRGVVPLGWGFCPNLADRIPGAFQGFAETASDRDRFVGCDTVAGYLNVTELEAPRPDGRPDGIVAWQRWAAPWVQRMSVRSTLFALNGAAGAMTSRGMESMAWLTGDGVALWPGLQPPLGDFSGRTSTMLMAPDIQSDLFNGTPQAAAAIIAGQVGTGATFSVHRSVLGTPTWFRDVGQVLHDGYAEPIHIVDPAVLWRLRELSLGQTPRWRASWLEADVGTPSAGAGSITVRIRNEGFETWPADGSWRVGAHVEGRIDPDQLPSQVGGYPFRQPLPQPVGPGEEVEVTLPVTWPASGRHEVQVDLVQEGVSWFETRNNRPWRGVVSY